MFKSCMQEYCNVNFLKLCNYYIICVHGLHSECARKCLNYHVCHFIIYMYVQYYTHKTFHHTVHVCTDVLKLYVIY